MSGPRKNQHVGRFSAPSKKVTSLQQYPVAHIKCPTQDFGAMTLWVYNYVILSLDKKVSNALSNCESNRYKLKRLKEIILKCIKMIEN